MKNDKLKLCTIFTYITAVIAVGVYLGFLVGLNHGLAGNTPDGALDTGMLLGLMLIFVISPTFVACVVLSIVTTALGAVALSKLKNGNFKKGLYIAVAVLEIIIAVILIGTGVFCFQLSLYFLLYFAVAAAIIAFAVLTIIYSAKYSPEPETAANAEQENA